MLFYQDFNEQFEGYTQHNLAKEYVSRGCFIRISMNNLKDIHNRISKGDCKHSVVLSGFQWTIWRIYTTGGSDAAMVLKLFYQDFNEQFEGYTQPAINDLIDQIRCFIRISMNNLKDIHNLIVKRLRWLNVVLSGFQWTILLQKYRKNRKYTNLQEIILIFQKKALPLQQQIWRIYTIRIIPLCKHSEWHASVALFLCISLTSNTSWTSTHYLCPENLFILSILLLACSSTSMQKNEKCAFFCNFLWNTDRFCQFGVVILQRISYFVLKILKR